MRKIGIAFMVAAILLTAVIPMNGVFAVTITGSDYANAFTKSIQFYDANRCGPNAASGNVFSWRSACHTTDGSDIGKDLAGGFHDAGDHVKFGLPQAYAAAVLGTALYEFKSTFDAQSNTSKMLSTLKYFTDYFLKCHPDANTFYYQVGDGNADHQYWGAPENQTGSRPTLYVANSAHPASDVCGSTAAALALMYLNYKSTDATYANTCLTAAKELYALGKNYLGIGTYQIDNSTGQGFYTSNGYWDDLALAATWLYVAENNSAYLTEIDSYLSNNTKWGNSPYLDQWTFCWDSVYDLVFCKMAELTGLQKYKDAMTYNFNYWKSGVTTTAGGLKYLGDGWGVLRYAAAESMLALMYYKQTNDASLTGLAKSQIDYILGSNPRNMSYVIGFGSTYPTHPHHRAANPTKGTATYTLTGGLVGGPDTSDNYTDDVNQYRYTEVSIDYNAGLVGALAGAVKYLSGGATATPMPTPTGAETPTPTPTAPSTATATPTPTPTPTTTPADGNTYQAENGASGGGTVLETIYSGYNGSGYINLPSSGGYIEFQNVNGGTGGAATLKIRNALGATSSRTGRIQVNGGTWQNITFDPTGAWTTWVIKEVSTTLNSGTGNTIRLESTGQDLANIDEMAVTISGSTSTPTPTPTPTATPTPTPGAGGIKVMMYNGTTASSVQSLNPHFKLVNTGTSAINLADVKIRYYFTEDGTQALVFACDWASAGNANITNSFVTVAKTNADTYCEIGFTGSAGTLAAGAYTEMFIQIHKSDWSNMTQTNDYSFNSTASNYVDWNNSTGYITGSLRWGTEP